MGQFISTNHTDNSNDELINTLIKREYIQTINVEKVFRSVDRGLYYTKDNKLNAYRDSAWQSGDVHLSAPSVYATVLECLDLHKGHAFLNIGSGIGYFSTLAGLLLGVNGVNHGIEIRGSSIDIAYQKLEEFKQKSAAIDYFEFCEPVFIKGNACELLSVGYYDRVYCGAGVPPAESSFMKSLIKIGGVLVMPLEGFLVKAIRTGEYSWKTIQVLEVSFADLVVPEKCSSMKVSKFPTVEPLSLQELCRSSIRASIRDCLNQSYPGLQIRTKCKSTKLDEQKIYGPHDPLGQFVRLQYDTADGEMFSMRNIVDTFAALNDSMSDLSSTSDNEAIEEDNDNNNSGNDDDDDDEDDHDYVVEEENYNSNSSSDDEDDRDEDEDDDDDDDDDDEEENTSKQCDKSLLKKTESDTKRKSLEAECSEQNKALPEKSENTKRMRMNTLPSTVTNLLNSQSTNSSGDIWETMFGDLSEPDDDDDLNDSNSLVSSGNDNNDGFGEIYNSLFNGEDIDNSDDSDTDSEVARELILYRFLSERKENELSKLLKVKIDLLPVPTTLKLFLNYNKEE